MGTRALLFRPRLGAARGPTGQPRGQARAENFRQNGHNPLIARAVETAGPYFISMMVKQIHCTCCAEAFLEEGAGHAFYCASDLIDGTVVVNHGSSHRTGSVLLATLPGALDLVDGVICDICIERLIASGQLFLA
jgi:hypothetical protein